MENSKHIRQLFRKYLDNSIDKAAYDELLGYFNIHDDGEDARRLIHEAISADAKESPVPEALIDEVVDQVQWKLDRQIRPLHRRAPIRRLLPYAAAAVLVFLSAALAVYWYTGDNRTQLVSQYGDDVLPGGNRAILTLADGGTIDLDSAANGLLAEQAGILVTKNEDGTITYEVQRDGPDAGTPAFNTISTPRGGQYKVILPDGSIAWLNAASSLRYPTAFTGGERAVALAGEGYFEVTADPRQPFVVRSGSQTVQVLGTQFNVSAYGDEYSMATTLVSGSVRVSGASGQSLTLRPGQQALNDGQTLEVHPVEVDDYTAWKEGLIVLDSAKLPEIIKQIERWYDVDFDIPAMANPNTAYVIINRNEKLSAVIRAMEKTYGIRLRIEGRRVMAAN